MPSREPVCSASCDGLAPAGAQRKATRWLAVAAVALAAALALVKLWPQRCDACGGWEFRGRAARLAPGWRMFCPSAPDLGHTPRLCKRCFDALLMMAPAHDGESRRVLAHYLTSPGSDNRLQQSIDSGLDRARTRQEARSGQPPD